MDSFLNNVIFGNTVESWLVALGITLGLFLVAKVIQKIVVFRLKKLTEKTKSTFDDVIITVIDKSLIPLAFIFSFYAGYRYLVVSPQVTRIIHVAILAVVIFFIIRAISIFLNFFVMRFAKARAGDELHARQAKGILAIVQIILWLLGIIFLIDNLGYDITTIVAGLGIGGIAIALAAQTILGDLFNYLVIFFDKPFEIGDFIIVDDKMGSVEYVGIKSTKIRALSGEQIIMSNTDLTSSRIQNYKRMQKRRIEFVFKVAYENTPEKLKTIPATVRKIIESEKLTQFDRAHFGSFGDFSLDFVVVYNILSADFNVYMDIQERINLAIFESFRHDEIRFAYPTQRLYVDNGEMNKKNEVNK